MKKLTLGLEPKNSYAFPSHAGELSTSQSAIFFLSLSSILIEEVPVPAPKSTTMSLSFMCGSTRDIISSRHLWFQSASITALWNSAAPLETGLSGFQDLGCCRLIVAGILFNSQGKISVFFKL